MEDFGKPRYINKEHFSLKTDDIKGAQPKKTQVQHVKLLKGNNSFGLSSLLKSDIPLDIDKQKFNEFVEKFSPSKKLNPETLLPYDFDFDDKFKPGKRQYENQAKNKDSLDYFKQEYQLKLEEAQLQKIQKQTAVTGKPNESDRKIVLSNKIQDYQFVDPFKKPYDSISSTPSGNVNTQFSAKGPNQNTLGKSPSANKLYTDIQTTEGSQDYQSLPTQKYLQPNQQQYQQQQYQQYQQQQQQYQQQQQQYQQQQQQQQQQGGLEYYYLIPHEFNSPNFKKNYDNFYRGYTPSVSGKEIPFNPNVPVQKAEKPQIDENDIRFKKNMDAFYGGNSLDPSEMDRFKLNEQKFYGVSQSNFNGGIQQQQQQQVESNYQKNLDNFYRGYTPDPNANDQIFTSPVQKQQKSFDVNDPSFRQNEKKFFGYSTNSSLGGFNPNQAQPSRLLDPKSFISNVPYQDINSIPNTKQLPDGFRKIESFDLISGLPSVKVMPTQGVRIPGEASKSLSLGTTKDQLLGGNKPVYQPGQR